MRKFGIGFVAYAAIAWAAGSPRRLSLEPGMPIEVRVAKAVSSETAQADERVEFTVLEDVKVGDEVVIARGSLAWGAVVAVTPRGRLARDGKLEIEVQGVCVADGSRAPIRAYRSDEAMMAPRETAMSETLLALPALPLLIFMQGKERVLPRGRELTVFSAQRLQVDSDRLTAGPHRDCTSAQALAEEERRVTMAASDLAVVAVRSTPASAEIQIDGAFAGNAPATLRLAPGPHRFTVSQPGYRLYDRMVMLTAGSEISLVVILDPKPAVPPSAGGELTSTAENRSAVIGSK